MQVDSPFQEIVDNLSLTSSQAGANYHAYWKERSQVFEGWCVNAIEMIAGFIKSPQNRLVAIQRILDTFIPEAEK